jgi:ferredoxin
MYVTVDRGKCIGAGQCAFTAPNVFDQGEDDGLVILLDAQPPESESDATREAASLCPAEVIDIGES